MALVYIEDNDPWLAEYEACEKLFRDIMEQLTARERESETSQAYASLSANIRLRMKQYNREIYQLKTKVEEASKSRTITIEEAERRTRQIEQLQSKDIQLQKFYESRTKSLLSNRKSLLKSGTSAFADMGTTSWAIDDDDDKPIDVNMSTQDLQNYQEQVLQEQDKGLEELCKVIARQKEIGQTISNEVVHQNEIIDDLADHMDMTDQTLINRTRQVESISYKDRTCGYWIIIILLFISIVVVALLEV
ncbi:PREDICTED: syntaxin-8 [Polistes canadensis]|uniref:syntaxin-8 n=1 Tax=Polistes canadensis TaxID=91411 RepID=UPI000718B3BF|nr:PREDICTED: syntaxin-8 [Polistes canadensis]